MMGNINDNQPPRISGGPPFAGNHIPLQRPPLQRGAPNFPPPPPPPGAFAIQIPPPPPPPPPAPPTSSHIGYAERQPQHQQLAPAQPPHHLGIPNSFLPHHNRPGGPAHQPGNVNGVSMIRSAPPTSYAAPSAVPQGSYPTPTPAAPQQSYYAPAATSAPPVHPEQQHPPSQDHIDQAWSEHEAPNGMKYYYNSLSKESTYHKPEALKKIIVPKSAEWKEYVDASSGKTYYSNGISTTWDKPAALNANVTTASTAISDTASTPIQSSSVTNQQQQQVYDDDEPRKKKKRKMETEFNNKEEAIAAFKGLLLSKDIAPSLKWHEVVKICSTDGRWEACEDVLSTGERKQALAEYQTKRANELRTIERQERARAKEMFLKLLSEVLPGVEGFSAWNSRFADVRATLSKDDRFHAVADEPTRESLYIDFCEEFRKRDERKKRNKRREAQDAFLTFLSDKHEMGILTYSTTWKIFRSMLNEKDNSDIRFAVNPHMSDDDRQLYFSDFVLELQAMEDDKRRRIRDAEERAEQEQRDAFRSALAELAVQGKLLPASRWRHIEELVTSLPSFGQIQAQDREAPREIFEEFANEWNDIYRRDRSFLSQLVFPSSKSDAAVKRETTYEEFTKALLDLASESSEMYGQTRMIISREEPVSSARLYYNELSMRSRGLSGPAVIRQGRSLRRKDSESSEDEGEIVEEGEITDLVKR